MHYLILVYNCKNFFQGMTKKRVVIKFGDLSPELLELFKQKYPHGYQNHVIKVEKPGGDYFFAVTLDSDDASYLVKVNVKIDSKIKDEEDEKEFFGGLSDDIGSENDAFPDDMNEEDEPSEEMSDDL